MNEPFDIVCCSLEDWDDVWRRNQFLVRELLALEPSGRVMFVEPPHDVVHGARTHEWRRPRPALRSVPETPRLWVFKPTKLLPRVVGAGADRHLASQVRRAARRLGFRKPTLWINDAAYATLATQIAWPVLYDITDDWLLADATPRELRRRRAREQFLLSSADEVVVCSPGLAATRKAARPVRVITNAVDALRYATPAPRPNDLPAEPVAVYVGTLHRDRLDVDLVRRVAAEASQVHLAFIGPIALDHSDVAALRALPNITLLGPRPWHEVPAYLQHASVLIVPHVVSAFTDSLDPIKAYEYLASGRPVVSTGVAGFRDLGLPQVRCCEPEAFAASLVAAAADSRRFSPPPLPAWREQATMFRSALRDAAQHKAARPLRVVYLDHSAEMSGAELALARLLPAMTDVDPLVVLAESGPLEDRLARDAIPTTVLVMSPATQSLRRDRVGPGTLPVRAVFDTARYVWALRRYLRQLRPDVVHTNSLKAAVYGSVAGRLAGVAVVCHVRDRIAPDYLPRAAVVALRVFLRRVPSAVITNSAATMATVADATRPGKQLTCVIHDAVQRPASVTRRAEGEPFCVGMVGRLAPWKGQHVFVEAFAAAFGGSDARARIVGAALFGEADYEATLRDLVVRHGLSDQVEFVGFVDDVYAEFARMDAFVHASVIAEPFGQVVIEAMAAGVPVVASAAGGPLEIIESGVTGLLVPPGDGAALADALRLLEKDPALRRRLADSATQTLSRFDPVDIGAQVRGVYVEVAARRGAVR